MKVRAILVCTLSLLAAVPSFALPLCQECIYETNTCEVISGAIERCRYNTVTGLCYTTPDPCSIPRAATVLTEWKVTSVDVTRPSLEAVTAKAPAPQPEVAKPAPAELK